eukprot:4023777-Amphidinium_carterae.1
MANEEERIPSVSVAMSLEFQGACKLISTSCVDPDSTLCSLLGLKGGGLSIDEHRTDATQLDSRCQRAIRMWIWECSVCGVQPLPSLNNLALKCVIHRQQHGCIAQPTANASGGHTRAHTHTHTHTRAHIHTRLRRNKHNFSLIVLALP